MSDLISKIMPSDDEPKAFILFCACVALTICCAVTCCTWYQVSTFAAATEAGLVQKAKQVDSGTYWVKP